MDRLTAIRDERREHAAHAIQTIEQRLGEIPAERQQVMAFAAEARELAAEAENTCRALEIIKSRYQSTPRLKRTPGKREHSTKAP